MDATQHQAVTEDADYGTLNVEVEFPWYSRIPFCCAIACTRTVNLYWPLVP